MTESCVQFAALDTPTSAEVVPAAIPLKLEDPMELAPGPVDFHHTPITVGAEVYHSDEFDESYGTVTKIAPEGFFIRWDESGYDKEECYPYSFGQWLIVQG